MRRDVDEQLYSLNRYQTEHSKMAHHEPCPRRRSSASFLCRSASSALRRERASRSCECASFCASYIRWVVISVRLHTIRCDQNHVQKRFRSKQTRERTCTTVGPLCLHLAPLSVIPTCTQHGMMLAGEKYLLEYGECNTRKSMIRGSWLASSSESGIAGACMVFQKPMTMSKSSLQTLSKK